MAYRHVTPISTFITAAWHCPRGCLSPSLLSLGGHLILTNYVILFPNRISCLDVPGGHECGGLSETQNAHSSEGRQLESEEPEIQPKSVFVEVHSRSAPPDCLPWSTWSVSPQRGARQPGAPGLHGWTKPWREIRRDGVGMRVREPRLLHCEPAAKAFPLGPASTLIPLG